jgi:putative cardiolipin synthase
LFVEHFDSFAMYRPSIAALILLALAGCATVPGSHYAKQESTALAHPETTRFGQQADVQARAHAGLAGFRLVPQGVDGFLLRAEMAGAAERTLDLQYFVIQNDETGKMLMDGVLRAAERGVRVRMLLDDSDDVARDRQILALAAHPNIQIRIFNPFFSRGILDFMRSAEFVVASSRLNYRMHNKLFVADNSIAILGGRNIGDEYFQASKETEFGDFDVLTIGPLVSQVSKSFDNFWNSDLAIPLEALSFGKPSSSVLDEYRAALAENLAKMAGSPYVKRLAAGDPLTPILTGRSALVWAKGEVLYDSPEKSKVQSGEQPGRLLRQRLGEAIKGVKTELLVVSPYLVPGDGGMRLLDDLRNHGVHVRILTNSLASTDMPIVHSGYQKYREPMLKDGIELYEVRPVLGKPDGQGSGGSLKNPSGGQFALHAKVFVLDRRSVFVGSMNFDRRSLRLNTELGVLIDSPELARQVIARFNAIAQPANSYVPTLTAADANGKQTLIWKTQEDGKAIELQSEPMGDLMKGVKTNLLTLLPLDDLL